MFVQRRSRIRHRTRSIVTLNMERLVDQTMKWLSSMSTAQAKNTNVKKRFTPVATQIRRPRMCFLNSSVHYKWRNRTARHCSWRHLSEMFHMKMYAIGSSLWKRIKSNRNKIEPAKFTITRSLINVGKEFSPFLSTGWKINSTISINYYESVSVGWKSCFELSYLVLR